MKKKVLLSSIVTIALCLCLIAGSTFALFTDSTDFNIGVTSGDVEILATAEVAAVYSAKAVTEASTDPGLFMDENDAFYIHEAQNDKRTFVNGGTAEVVDGKVVLSRVTPGDKVDVKINIANTSNVAISYRYKLIADDKGANLAKGMVATTFNADATTTSTKALALWVSEWYSAEAPAGTPDPIPTRTISIELPIDAGNDYQTERAENKIETVEYTLLVEAVQHNANTKDESHIRVYTSEVIENVPPVLSGDYIDPETNMVHIKDLHLQNGAKILVDQNNVHILENVTVDVHGSAIVFDEYQPTIMISDCDFLLDDGEYIIDASAIDGGIGQVFIQNVTVNGVLLPQGTCHAEIAQYFNNVYYYSVSNPNVNS